MPITTRTVTLIVVALAALTCTMFSLVCLGHDATVAALTVTAIVLSGVGIILLTFFISEGKNSEGSSDVVLHTVRVSPERPTLPAYPAPFVPPFPIPPPQLIGDSLEPPALPSPPSYDESAEIEDRRITDNSNAPPAYNRTDLVSDNNIASFSPPPFYSPPSPYFGTSVQTTTIYLSAENVSESPVPSEIRAPSPVRRNPARKMRRSPRNPKPQQTVIVIDTDGASTSSAVPKSPTRSTLPQMFIDCSKAEPALFTINGGLWDD